MHASAKWAAQSGTWRSSPFPKIATIRIAILVHSAHRAGGAESLRLEREIVSARLSSISCRA
jgi:hypothetical protein